MLRWFWNFFGQQVMLLLKRWSLAGGVVQKLISLGRAWLRKTWRNNQSVDVSLSGPKFKIDFNRKDEPIETRTGLSAKGRKPFYESSAYPLLGYYFGYQKSTDVAQGLLYADIVPLKSDKMHGLSLEALAVDDIRVKIEPVAYRLPSKLRDHQQAALKIFKELKKLNFNSEFRNGKTTSRSASMRSRRTAQSLAARHDISIRSRPT